MYPLLYYCPRLIDSGHAARGTVERKEGLLAVKMSDSLVISGGVQAEGEMVGQSSCDGRSGHCGGATRLPDVPA